MPPSFSLFFAGEGLRPKWEIVSDQKQMLMLIVILKKNVYHFVDSPIKNTIFHFFLTTITKIPTVAFKCFFFSFCCYQTAVLLSNRFDHGCAGLCPFWALSFNPIICRVLRNPNIVLYFVTYTTSI